ncbi:S8 family peptidase [Anditalea andensis]|uniref:Peptidase S8/S53 domain-containing protein n=1 Tax=Anditalea andensis TaxID=1048983 RepID=A0A074KTU6_9BACT|nr:S8 family peptidase [Anditalea andensis]KEO71665.1 hypothetical protein EL17_23435 [Anditalea andensis]
MADFSHRYLKNDYSSNDGFRKSRNIHKEESKKESDEKTIPAFRRESLRISYMYFSIDREVRNAQRTLPLPEVVDLMEIHFFKVFDQKLRKSFSIEYGLEVVEYSNFNKSVLFEINDQGLFESFVAHLFLVFDLKDNDSYEHKPYNKLALIYSFNFFSAIKRQGVISGSEAYLVSLCELTNNYIHELQLEFMLAYLEQNNIDFTYDSAIPDMLVVNLGKTVSMNELTDNFDIIRLVTSARAPVIKPGEYGTPRREYGFDVNVPEDIPLVGVIDTGISAIEPLNPVLSDLFIDHTGKGAYWDDSGHGTMVGGLLAFGADFYQGNKELIAKAKLVPIKVIHHENDDINIIRLLKDLREAHHAFGIRLFNMSLNLPGNKSYNSQIGKLAYELDKLAYEEDLMIFVSVGNSLREDIEFWLTEGKDPGDIYTHFFYNSVEALEGHDCSFTNIMEPAEAMNLIAVGALAGNLEEELNLGITPAKEYPAFYTRKFHYDYDQKINASSWKKTQKNKNLIKPDLVFEGGDFLDNDAGMEILRSPLDATQPYFGRCSGTSLATPLVTSLAAEIIHAYPKLKMESVKALLVNSTVSPAGKNPVHFQNGNEKLYKKLVGNGKPTYHNLLENDKNSIVLIVEDSISYDQVKGIPVQLPKSFAVCTTGKLQVTATLVYKFLPVRNNHLAYLPLHISFGIFKPLAAVELAHNKIDNKYKLNSGNSWSEDFHGVEDRVFSNVQKIDFLLSPSHLACTGSQFHIGVRCSGKKDIPESDLDHLMKGDHPFSIVLKLREIPQKKNDAISGTLYQDIVALNSLELVTDISGDVDLEAGL